MIDIATQIGAIERSVTRTPREDGGENVTVLARRTYRAEPDDTWSALTDPARVARWFMPLSGDLRVGGSFQLEGNAGGEILECDRPNRFRVTFNGETSIVEVRLAAAADGMTALELEHTVPIEMAQSGAGALWVGPGWDGGLLALGPVPGRRGRRRPGRGRQLPGGDRVQCRVGEGLDIGDRGVRHGNGRAAGRGGRDVDGAVRAG